MLGAAQMLQGNRRKDISQATVSTSCNSSLICILFFNPQQNNPFKFKHSDWTDLQDYKDLQNSVGGGPALLSHLATTVSASYAGRIELHDD